MEGSKANQEAVAVVHRENEEVTAVEWKENSLCPGETTAFRVKRTGFESELNHV